VEIFKEFSLQAAHKLPNVPAGHKCARLHGHSYRVGVYVAGPLGASSGWVIDFADIKAAFEPNQNGPTAAAFAMTPETRMKQPHERLLLAKANRPDSPETTHSTPQNPVLATGKARGAAATTVRPPLVFSMRRIPSRRALWNRRE